MLLSKANILKTINYCKKNGIKDTYYASLERIQRSRKEKYFYCPPEAAELEKQKSDNFERRPKLSLLVPAYETKAIYIEDLVLSVAEQSYLNYELIIADASESSGVERMVKGLQEVYDNIIYKRLDCNAGISENTNAALELATGEYIGLLDHDDIITADALYYIAKAIEKAGAPALIYTDEDKTDSWLESYYEPNIKPKINKELILTNNYICHLTFIRADIIKELKLRKEYDGAQDYDLVLRTIAYVMKNYPEDDLSKWIIHIPRILYHWRCHQDSTAANPQSKMYAYEAGKRAVEDFLSDTDIKAEVSHLKHLGFYRVDYPDGIFSSRKDIAIVGGPIYLKDKIVSGALNGKGQCLYKGLNRHFSGDLNRAVLQQNVDVVDIRNIMLRDDYLDLFREVTGLTYPIKDKNDINKHEDEFYIKKSIIFCNKLRAAGIGILYEPSMGLDLDK